MMKDIKTFYFGTTPDFAPERLGDASKHRTGLRAIIQWITRHLQKN